MFYGSVTRRRREVSQTGGGVHSYVLFSYNCSGEENEQSARLGDSVGFRSNYMEMFISVHNIMS